MATTPFSFWISMTLIIGTITMNPCPTALAQASGAAPPDGDVSSLNTSTTSSSSSAPESPEQENVPRPEDEHKNSKDGVAKTHKHHASHKSSSTHTLPWLDVETGFARAKRRKQLVLVDFYTDWCHWCKVMARDTFPDPAVQERLKSFVLVRANAEDGGAGEELAHDSKINAYPTIGIFDADRKSKILMEGYKKPSTFVTNLTDFLDGKPVTDSED